MGQYVDGYLLPVPKKNLKAYKVMATKGAKIWREHGALDYRECVGDDLNPGFGLPFTKVVKVKPGETVFFSYVTFKSRAQRDKVNAAVMKDPRLSAMCDPKNMPFDCKRMAMGGFETLVKG